MVGLGRAIFGYRVLSVDPAKLRDAVNIIVRAGLAAECRGEGSIIIAERDRKEVERLFAKRVEYSLSPPYGGARLLYICRKHLVAVVAAALALALYFLSPALVWDVRIDGNERLEEGEIAEALYGAGLYRGRLWRGLDLSLIEERVLTSENELSWISVNRRGSVAYVQVMERAAEDAADLEEGYYSIVADRDCVIERLTVTGGRAMVSVGDTVRRGDVIISGVIENEKGYELTRASGIVEGRCFESKAVRVGTKETVEERSEAMVLGVKLKIFNFFINFLEDYRKTEGQYVIIEEERALTLPSGVKLPLSLVTVYKYEIISQEVTYSEGELPSIARERMNEMIIDTVDEGDLLSVRSRGGYFEGGYEMISDIQYSAPVGRLVKIGS